MTANVDRVRWFKISKKKYRIRHESSSARPRRTNQPPHAEKRHYFKLRSQPPASTTAKPTPASDTVATTDASRSFRAIHPTRPTQFAGEFQFPLGGHSRGSASDWRGPKRSSAVRTRHAPFGILSRLSPARDRRQKPSRRERWSPLLRTLQQLRISQGDARIVPRCGERATPWRPVPCNQVRKGQLTSAHP